MTPEERDQKIDRLLEYFEQFIMPIKSKGSRKSQQQRLQIRKQLIFKGKK